MGTRPEKLPATRRHKSTSMGDEGARLRVDWVDELFAAIDTRRR